jgi:hypothetical protein
MLTAFGACRPYLPYNLFSTAWHKPGARSGLDGSQMGDRLAAKGWQDFKIVHPGHIGCAS